MAETEKSEEEDVHEEITTECKEAIKKQKVDLELGDIIEIIAPTNPDLNENTFFIYYIDNKTIRLKNIADSTPAQLNIIDGCHLSDESITRIHLLSRSDEPGYARQNNLLVGKWIEVNIRGEVPVVFVGEITDLEEDQIEITTYPDLAIIYIDFAYKGIPEYIPIETIILRAKPPSLVNVKSLKDIRMVDTETAKKAIEGDAENASIEYLENGESIVYIPEEAEPDPSIKDALQSLYNKTTNFIFSENLVLGEELQEIDLPENERKYGIDIQANNMMDELLSTIPTSQRTKRVMDKIQVMIERFKELREEYSVFDENGDVLHAKKLDPVHKPAIDRIQQMDAPIRWLIPVVKQKSVGYIVDGANADANPPDIEVARFDETMLAENEIARNAYNQDATNKYQNYHNQLNEFYTPMRNPSSTDECVNIGRVRANIECIVSNMLDSFYRTTIRAEKSGESYLRRKFVIQTYNLGLNRVEMRDVAGKTTNRVLPMTPADTAHVVSYLSMPYSIVQFSKIDMPSTRLSVRSDLHSRFLSLSRVLRNADIYSRVVENLAKEVDAGESGQFLEHMTEYLLDKNVADRDTEKFLSTFIPNTWDLIDRVNKHDFDKYTVQAFIDELEPFYIYSKDISYSQSLKIRKLLREKIAEFKKAYSTRRDQYRSYLEKSYDVKRDPVKMLRILMDKKEVLDQCITAYKMQNTVENMHSSEILARMIELDQGTLFVNMMSNTMISLMLPDDIMAALEAPPKTDEPVATFEDCNKRTLAKQYETVAALQKDNHSDEVYFDEDFDNTPYYLLDKYKDKQKEKDPDEFVKWFAETLIQKHSCPKELADKMAKTIVAKKRAVEDDEYAMLKLVPKAAASTNENTDIEREVRTKFQFYKRKNGIWVHDSGITQESFMDSNTLFCNLSKECYGRISSFTTTCESVDSTEARMKRENYKRLTNEFDRRFEVSVGQMKKAIETRVVKQLKHLIYLRRCRETELHRYNNAAYNMGLTVKHADVVRSPYTSLRGQILGNPDFAKKQTDILRYYELYCREPRTTEDFKEDIHWKYCRETDTKLLPAFYVSLAEAFVYHGQYAYGKRLAEICATNGVLSDDGDAIIDRYTGDIMCKIDFIDEQGYTGDGFLIKHADLMQEDMADKVLRNLRVEKVMESEQSRTILRIYRAICANIGVVADQYADFVLRISNHLCDKHIESRETYEEFVKKSGKKLISYDKKRNKTIIQVITCAILVAVQTSIPHFRTNKVFPGCVYSFEGYPLTGVENMDALQYLSCVLNGMQTKTAPWDSIYKVGVVVLTEQLRNVMELYFLAEPEIETKYLAKREYMALHPEEDIPSQLSGWTSFMPPLMTLDMKTVKSVSADFSEDFMRLMREGKTEQWIKFLVIKHKIAEFSCAVVESIQKIVGQKKLLMKTAGNEPFLQNACCNDGTYHPMSYFIQEDESIRRDLKTVATMSQWAAKYVEYSRTSTLFHNMNTRVKYAELPKEPTEENIYAAFIHYCDLDRGIPVPLDLREFFTETPAKYDPRASMVEKIDFLKREANKRFTVDDYARLIRIVQQRPKNRVTQYQSVAYKPIHVLQDVLSTLETQGAAFAPGNFIERLRKILDLYDPKKMHAQNPTEEEEGEMIKANNRLKNLLYTVNTNMYKQVLDFLSPHLKKNVYVALERFLSSIQVWDLGGMHDISKFFCNAIYEFTRLFPNILLNKCKNQTRIHSYWDFSRLDVADIQTTIKAYYDELSPFFDDSVIQKLLDTMRTSLSNLHMFVQSIPVFRPIEKSGVSYYSLFDKETVYMLYSYAFYSVLVEYINASSREDMLRIDVVEQRQNAIKANSEDPVYEGSQSTTEEMEDYMELNNYSMDILMGDQAELKTRVAKLLIAFLKIAERNKAHANFGYDRLMHQIHKYKHKEKAVVLENLEKMQTEERNVEKLKMKHKLGKWNVGQQRGLFVYDKIFSDRERMEHEIQGYTDIGDEDTAFGNSEAAFDDAEMEQHEEDVETDINHLKEGYADGQFYSEDEDEEFIE